jgi:phage terminase large subunit-like protein
MSEPSKFLEKILHGGEVDLLKDPVLRWMFRNVVILQDTNDNIRPDKKRSQNKIDGVVALITALGGYLSKQSLDEMFNSGKLRIINI